MPKTNGDSLENKKTSELLDLLDTLIDDRGNLLEGYGETKEELLSREPFYSLEHPKSDQTTCQELADIEEDIKKLKRHKHDEKNGDVLVRI